MAQQTSPLSAFNHFTGRRRQSPASVFSPLVAFAIMFFSVVSPLALADESSETRFRRIDTQYIAALADPAATAGGGAQNWGIWRVDPGPRGVWIKHFDKFFAQDSTMPKKWQFDAGDWWLDENGLIMEQPDFPVAAGKYVVTGGREVTTILTVHSMDADGNQKWELEDGTLHDVTHMPCRSARYTPLSDNAQETDDTCLPSSAERSDFPVAPGSIMPTVKGCHKQDYSVLIVIGVAVES